MVAALEQRRLLVDLVGDPELLDHAGEKNAVARAHCRIDVANRLGREQRLLHRLGCRDIWDRRAGAHAEPIRGAADLDACAGHERSALLELIHADRRQDDDVGLLALLELVEDADGVEDAFGGVAGVFVKPGSSVLNGRSTGPAPRTFSSTAPAAPRRTWPHRKRKRWLSHRCRIAEKKGVCLRQMLRLLPLRVLAWPCRVVPPAQAGEGTLWRGR